MVECNSLYRIQSTWDGDSCNKIQGTDSTIFPPYLRKEEGLWTFTPDICMSLKSHYVRDSSFDGMPSRIYSADFGDMKNDPENHCFCNEYPDECPPKGTLDLFPCVKAPIYGNLLYLLFTHFLESLFLFYIYYNL
jgi:scavenger receptor class B, member 1